MSRSKIKKTLEKRGIPESLINDLLKGDFKYFYPSEQIQERFKDISRETGQPNPFLQSRGIVNAMRNVFKGLSLYRDFNMNLEDFMPKASYYNQESKLPTPPLDTQPMPKVNNQQMAMAKHPQTNLTRSEEALLSPSEKIIAGRT